MSKINIKIIEIDALSYMEVMDIKSENDSFHLSAVIFTCLFQLLSYVANQHMTALLQKARSRFKFTRNLYLLNANKR